MDIIKLIAILFFVNNVIIHVKHVLTQEVLIVLHVILKNLELVM